MERRGTGHLREWANSPSRKPLILRGARQVGKSTLVRLFCEGEGWDLIEVNLEVEKLNSAVGENVSLQHLLDEIQLRKNKRIGEKSLLFFDEIQDSPPMLKWLRYFYEERPDLRVIAAGSMLELAFEAQNFSFPVGRVAFYHLGPMDFGEFLLATGEEILEEKLGRFDFSSALHGKALECFKEYLFVGGMPEAVKEFAENRTLRDIRGIQEHILQAYQADFPKYNKRIHGQRITRVFQSLALGLGQKMVYSRLDAESKSRDIRRVVELLIDARVILPCYHSDGAQIPLLGQRTERIFKTYFLDVGLFNAMARLDIDSLDREFKNSFNTKGAMAEQYVAQHLQFFHGASEGPSLN